MKDIRLKCWMHQIISRPSFWKIPMTAKFILWTVAMWKLILKGRMRVNYKNQVPDKKYLAINKFPATAKVQISALDIIDGFVIEENGYFYEQSEVTNIGYWAWKKLAELLPYDYNPE